ncbi:MAG: hypothetical protein FWD71_08465 [Oscillospiraceae bacterium]|nr:hypothetical protein [Oscillospiraceae bacterium]
MSKSIFEDLYYGRINPFEKRTQITPEREEIENKIKDEKRYLQSKLSPDDCERLQSLENLFTEASADDEITMFAHGCIFGALLIFEIMERKEEIVNE